MTDGTRSAIVTPVQQLASVRFNAKGNVIVERETPVVFHVRDLELATEELDAALLDDRNTGGVLHDARREDAHLDAPREPIAHERNDHRHRLASPKWRRVGAER